jgi:hypothetical protein
MWGTGNWEKMQLYWRVYIETCGGGATGVLVLVSADLERMIISLGAGDLGTDLWWDHEGDGRLFFPNKFRDGVTKKREGGGNQLSPDTKSDQQQHMITY